jgi:hypothetical protein
MEYKVLHSSDLEADLNAAAAEGWELFSDPQPYRRPGSPDLWLVVMERSGDPVTTVLDHADSITLNTIRDWALRNHASPPLPFAHDHARGYARAVDDVRAILAVHGQPPDTPVHFGETL